MKTQKIVNLLSGLDNESAKIATKKWHIIDSESKDNYSHHSHLNPIKLLINSIESSLSDYSDAYILVTRNIAVRRTIAGNPVQRKQVPTEATQVVFKNCAPFEKCSTEIDDTLVDEANFINITMLMYNLIEYSDNYSDTSGSLWGFKRDELVDNANLTNDDNAPSFKYKATLIGNIETDGRKKGVKTAQPLKYLSSFWRSLEMPWINFKVELSLNWIKNCVLTTAQTDANANNTGADSATFKITDAKLYVPIVTLSAEDNAKLLKLLGEGFKRSVYWNKYKVILNNAWQLAIIDNYAANNEEKYIRKLLDSSYQGVKRLFVLAYDSTASNDQVSIGSFKKYFLLRVKIENYNIKIDGRNFYDQSTNDSLKQFDEIRKISTGQCDGYRTGCLLDFAYFEKNYRLIAADSTKQKALDADSRAIIIYYTLEQSKETILGFAKGTIKVL